MHAAAAFSPVCHSGQRVASAGCTLYSWKGAAWAWPAIQPPTTRVHRKPRKLPLLQSARKNALLSVCISGVNSNHLALFLSFYLRLCLCVWASPFILMFLHSPQGTLGTAAIPMTTSVLLPIINGCLILCGMHLYTCTIHSFDRCADGTSENCIAQISKCMAHFSCTYINPFMLWIHKWCCHLLATSDFIIILIVLNVVCVLHWSYNHAAYKQS